MARRKKRLGLMRNFLWWAYVKENKRWSESNNEERMIVQRHFGHGRFMFGFASVTTFLIYNAFFRGIYNWRAREILNMRRVPFAIKFGISALIGVTLSYKMHIENMYDPDLYKVALKYRTYYDKEFQEEVDYATTGGAETDTKVQ